MSRRGVLGPGTNNPQPYTAHYPCVPCPQTTPLYLSSSHPYKPNTSITLPHIPTPVQLYQGQGLHLFDNDAVVRGGPGCRRAAGGGPECTAYAKVESMWVWCWDVGHTAARM